MALPVIGLDFDGVICRPPFGLNIGISAGEWDQAKILAAQPHQKGNVHNLASKIRYSRRVPLKGVGEALAELSRHRRVALITGRPSALQPAVLSWLKRYDLDKYFWEIHLNDSGLPTAVQKLRVAQRLGATEFAEDDGRTVRFLSQMGMTRVFLLDWPRNRATYPANVSVVSGLGQVARLCATE